MDNFNFLPSLSIDLLDFSTMNLFKILMDKKLDIWEGPIVPINKGGTGVKIDMKKLNRYISISLKQ